MVQIISFYDALPVLLGIEMSPAMAAVLALSLYGGAFYSEIIRAGIAAYDASAVESVDHAIEEHIAGLCGRTP